jgi:hypothetical protein
LALQTNLGKAAQIRSHIVATCPQRGHVLKH